VDVAIVGGGLNGPLLGAALLQAGFRVTVIDAGGPSGNDARAYALAQASCRVLGALGLWPAIAPSAQPIKGVTVTDGRAGEGPMPLRLQASSAEIEEGPMGHMIPDAALRPVLANAVAGHVTAGRVVEQVADPGGMTLTLDTGTQVHAALVVGADGRGSGTATRAGIGRQVRDYGQTAITCTIAHTRPHKGIAHQFFMPSGPLAILPLTGDRVSIVWTEGTARAADLMALDDDGFLTALRPAFGSFLGDITLAAPRMSWPLSLSVARSLTADRVALVGDAAHGVHPIAGQGLNAGFRDVAALAQVLGEARQRGEDIGSAPVLARYARWRRADSAGLVAATDGFNRLFSNDNPALRLIRGLGLGLTGAVPPLRRAVLREAAGLTGDLPVLMR
jgi:2-octaprenyl-6-methoxyphenol hydroxylase